MFKLANNKYLQHYWIYPLLLGLPYIFLQTIYYIHHEQNIYIWDHDREWQTWFYLVKLFKESVGQFIMSIFLDILISPDYSCSATVLLVPFHYLPFDQRTNFILGILLGYFLPLIILINYLFLYFKNFQYIKWILIITILTLTYTPFLGPSLRGYPDIIGLLPIVLVVTFTLSNDLSKQKTKFYKIFLIGFLLWLPFLFRRWYAYSILSLYLTLPILNLLIFNKRNEIKKEHLQSILHTFFYSGLISILLVSIFQLMILQTSFTTNYKYVYSAYQKGFIESFRVLYRNIGLLPIFLASIGVIWAIKGEKTKEKIFIIFCLANFIISFTCLIRTQTPSSHHCLPSSMWMFIISIFGLKILIDSLKSVMMQSITIIFYLFLSFLINISTLNRLPLNLFTNSIIFPEKIYPHFLYNYDNYLKLANALKNSNSRISVLASSYILTGQLLSKISPELSINYIPDIDLRDTFSTSIFLSQLVVVTVPIQLHANPDGQRIISIPAKVILNGENIGQAYKRLPGEYTLENNVVAFVYVKTRHFTLEESTDFIKLLIEAYPEWKEQLKDTPQEMTTF